MSCQFDLKCPECGSRNHLDIAATVWVRVTDHGTVCNESHDGSHDWDDNSIARCDNCAWEGKVRDCDHDLQDPMGDTYCDRCNNPLESGQIGLCDSCIDERENQQ